MDFKELLETYKKGEATPEQIRLVEEEIEKNKLVNDYICGDMEMEPPEPEESTAGRPDKESYKAVKKIMRRTLLKVAIIAAALVLAALLTAEHIVSPLVASRYYDPTKVIQEGKDDSRSITQGELDARVEYELIKYSDELLSYRAQDLGYGKYHVYMTTRDHLTMEVKYPESSLTTDINRSDYHLTTVFLYGPNNSRNRFGRLYFTGPEKIHDIPPDILVEAAVIFPEDLNMDQLVSLRDEHSELYLTWAAVKNTSYIPTAPGTEPNIGNMGFRPVSIYSSVKTPPAIEEQYPNLFLTSGRTPTAEDLTQHFMSLLTYICDRDEENIRKHQSYYRDDTMAWHKNSLNLVQKKGIRIYGAVVIGKYEDVVALYENGVIKGIQIYDTMSSVYENEIY